MAAAVLAVVSTGVWGGTDFELRLAGSGRHAVTQQDNDDSLCRDQIQAVGCPCSVVLWNVRQCREFLGHVGTYIDGFISDGFLYGTLSDDCLVVDTVCNVTHSAHGVQLLKDTYDFTFLCGGQLRISYEYSVPIAEPKGAPLVPPHGRPLPHQMRRTDSADGIIVKVRERTTVLETERDSKGHRFAEYLTANFADRLPLAGGTPSFHAEFLMEFEEYDEATSKSRITVADPEWLHISYQPEIAKCEVKGVCTGVACLGSGFSVVVLLSMVLMMAAGGMALLAQLQASQVRNSRGHCEAAAPRPGA
eukprot:Hpha_TRINITY_DN28591_c0_g1::TRINITY_DN28591_c0_g1_i1::g.18643::m.18643